MRFSNWAVAAAVVLAGVAAAGATQAQGLSTKV
jgi:hypothetical protein